MDEEYEFETPALNTTRDGLLGPLFISVLILGVLVSGTLVSDAPAFEQQADAGASEFSPEDVVQHGHAGQELTEAHAAPLVYHTKDTGDVPDGLAYDG
jgi:hypothetical protein